MERRVLISPIGLEYDRILSGLTKFPSKALYLIRDDEPATQDEGSLRLYKATYEFTQSTIKAAMDLGFEVEEKCAGVRLNVTEKCITVLCDIIKLEIESHNPTEIVINVSTATKNFALAAYYVAAYFQDFIDFKLFYLQATHYTILDLLNTKKPAECFAIIDEYLHKGLTQGPFVLEEIPIIPLIKLSTEAKKVLLAFIETSRFSNLAGLYQALYPEFTNLSNDRRKSIRMKYNYVMRKLEDLKMIKLEKKGRQISVSITERGKIISLLALYDSTMYYYLARKFAIQNEIEQSATFLAECIELDAKFRAKIVDDPTFDTIREVSVIKKMLENSENM